MSKNVSILGSCVTRDVFGFCTSNDWNVTSFVARTSFISMDALPIAVGTPLTTHSPFETRCIIKDFEKSYWEDFDFDCDYLVLDFIEERFDLIKVGGSIVLATETMLASGALSPYSEYQRMERLDPQTTKAWLQHCDRMCRELSKRYDPRRIILHKAYHASHSVSETGLEEFQGFHAKFATHHNQMLNDYYKHFLEQLPQVSVVQVGLDSIVADSKHPWGKQPFHYIRQYYHEIMNQINNLTSI